MLSPRIALSAVNILHLNGPLEAKQTHTGLHTNDQRGPGVRQGTRHVSVCVCEILWFQGWYELQTDRGSCVLDWKADCVWHRSGGCSGGWWKDYIGSLARGEYASQSQWVPICMSGPFVCVCMFSHYPSLKYYTFVSSNAFLCVYLCVLSIILSCGQAPVDSHQQCVTECCRGHSNKSVGLVPWSALCSLLLLIFEE